MNFQKSKKYIIILLTLILIIGTIVFRLNFKAKEELLSNTIKEKIIKIGELSTIKYNYTDILSYKNTKGIKGLNIPITEKGFIVQYSGYLKAGINMSNLNIDIKDKNTIYLKLGKGKVLENTIIEEETKFLDEKNGLFNKLKFEDLYKVLVEEKKKIETNAINNGLLKEAENNIEEILISLLEEIGFKEITIKFN